MTPPSDPRRGESAPKPRSGQRPGPTTSKKAVQAKNREKAKKRRKARGRGIRLLAVILIVVAIAVVGTHHSGKTTAAKTAAAVVTAPLNYSVGIVTCTLVDQSRNTYDYATAATTTGRTLVTEIRYPTLSPTKGKSETVDANPATRHGPFPTIEFGHGYNLTPDTYALLLDHWVRAGYVVIAPLFPDTNENVVTAEHDISSPESDDVNQPADFAFVATSIVAGETGTGTGCSKMHGLVNKNELGAAGQSDGATTVAMLLYNKSFALSSTTVKYKAAVSLSGQEWAVSSTAPNPYGVLGVSPPLLVTQSATDECNPPQDSTKLYNDIPLTNKWFFEIKHADHLPPYVGTAPEAFNAVAVATTDFFNMELKGAKIPKGFVKANNGSPLIAQMFTGQTAPVIASQLDKYQTCYLGE